MENWIMSIVEASTIYQHVYTQILRYAAPLLAFFILFRLIKPLVKFNAEPELWGWIMLEDGRRLPLTHWENVIGRSKRSDVVVDVPTVSRTHAVLTRYDDGSWTIADAGSKSGTRVNGKKVTIQEIEPEDRINIGGAEMTLLPISRKQEIKLAQIRTKAATPFGSILNVLLLTIFQALICLSYLFTATQEYALGIFWGFAGIAICQWVLLLLYLCIRKPSFEIEGLAFFLCTLGMAAISSVVPREAGKQLLALVIGVCTYLAIGISLRDLELAKKVRYVAGVAGVAFLVITLLFGTEYRGAKNWLVIGGMSFQLSELSKVCFVLVGASTMDRIVTKRNLILFILYTLILCGCLALMNDFGTALIFFVAFLVIAYMRSGSVGTLGLACTSLGFAGVIAVKIAPHAMSRFQNWRHIWEDPYGAGYQQTRALMCLASGGLFGLGAGNGWLNRVFAADCDIVFATISEEWGLLLALMAVACILTFGIYAFRSAGLQRSSFYAISSCTAAAILLVQTMFNVLGTVDWLPLTGVTFPFVSNGGSSMIGVWGLLAFLKAADTRQNASFAVRQSKEGRIDDE